MSKKRNSLPRKEAWKRFHDGIMNLRADIKSGVTTAKTFIVGDYFASNYGRYDIEPLLCEKEDPTENMCRMYMIAYNRCNNKYTKHRQPRQSVVEYNIEFDELTDERCINFLKPKGYKIYRPRPTEYDEV